MSLNKFLILSLLMLLVSTFIDGTNYNDINAFYEKIASNSESVKRIEDTYFYKISRSEAERYLKGSYYWNLSKVDGWKDPDNNTLAIVVSEETQIVNAFAQFLAKPTGSGNINGTVTDNIVFHHNGEWSIGRTPGGYIIFRCYKCTSTIEYMKFTNGEWVGNGIKNTQEVQIWFNVSPNNDYQFRLGSLDWHNFIKVQERAAVDEDDYYWNGVKSRNEIIGYENYISKFPNGHHINEAKAILNRFNQEKARRQEEEDWRLSKSYDGSVENQTKRLQQYLSKYPKGAHVDEAQTIINQNTEYIIWDNVKHTQTIDGYSSYISQYPQGRYIKSALESRYNLAIKSGLLQDFEKCLYPESEYTLLAKNRIDSMQTLGISYGYKFRNGEFAENYLRYPYANPNLSWHDKFNTIRKYYKTKHELTNYYYKNSVIVIGFAWKDKSFKSYDFECLDTENGCEYVFYINETYTTVLNCFKKLKVGFKESNKDSSTGTFKEKGISLTITLERNNYGTKVTVKHAQ